MRCAGKPVTSFPSKNTLPTVGATNPEIVRASVLLPAPLAPSTATTEPGCTVSETPKSAWDDP